jgi:putative transcriptional regulator
MKKNVMVRSELSSDKKSKGKTDWALVDALTEAEVAQNSLSDADNPPLTAQELRQLEPVVDVKEIRKRLNYSQLEFAKAFHLSKRTVQEWEQHRCEPDLPARVLLTIISKNPELVRQTLRSV